MELFGYAAGILMGLSLGLIGGGGSILTVPILVYLFKIPPIAATGYSLFIVGATALIGSLSALKAGRVDLKTALLFGVPSFFGVYLSRAFLVPSIPAELGTLFGIVFTKNHLVMGVFALLMVAASTSMIRTKKEVLPNSANKHQPLHPFKMYLTISVEGLIVGSITGLVGAGGGFLIIPALVLLRGLSMRVAVGTSLLIIAAKSLFGFLGDIQNNAVIDWHLLLTLTGIAVVGILAGSALSPKVNERLLKKAFGYFVLVMGLFILIKQFS